MKVKFLNGCKAAWGIFILCWGIYGCKTPELRENVDPSTAFDINISSTSGYAVPDDTQSVTLYLDGDSICFTTAFYSPLFHDDQWFVVEPSTDSLYEYVTNNNSDEWDFRYAELLPPSQIIENDLPDSLQWKTVKNGEVRSQLMIWGSSIMGPFNLMHFPADQDFYIAFRKLRPDGYLYFWVRVRNTLLPFFSCRSSVYDGKYQMNSIVTGQ